MISNYYKILIALLCLVYLINPMDFFPDYFPFLGWFDDSVLIGLFLYYLRYGRLPGFFGFGRKREEEFDNNRADSRNKTDQSRNYDNSSHGKTRTGTSFSSHKTPYEILGVSPGSTLDEVRGAYRRAAAKYHPDKVSHLGPEFQEMARIKFIEIQKAYEEITGKS